MAQWVKMFVIKPDQSLELTRWKERTTFQPPNTLLQVCVHLCTSSNLLWSCRLRHRWHPTWRPPKPRVLSPPARLSVTPHSARCFPLQEKSWKSEPLSRSQKNYYSSAPLYFYVYELTVESLGFYTIAGLKISIPKRGLSNTKKSRYQKESGQALLGLLEDRTSSCSIRLLHGCPHLLKPKHKDG